MERFLLLSAGDERRRLRIDRRIFDRQVRAAPRVDMEYSDLCLIGFRRRICDLPSGIALPALRDFRRHLRRVRRGGGLACRTFPESETARISSRLYAGFFRLWGRAGEWGRLSHRQKHRFVADDLWRARTMALSADFGVDPRNSIDRHPAMAA